MRRVTVVDDEPAALDVMVRAAQSWQYECQAATSAEEAIRLLEANLTPIVVTDLRMPGMGGTWLVKEIARRWPEVAVIVITAGEDDNALTQCLDAGAHHYFLKPIKFDEFQHALESNLRYYQMGREKERYRRRLERQLKKKTRALRSTYLSAVESLVRLVEARDTYLAGHSLRVRGYALELAKSVQLPRDQRQKLSLAAKLHDIGKVGVPEAILNKPGRLTREEFTVIQKHPEIGERILAPIIHNREILAAIRGHHERFDGTGYPDGLRGEEIPLLARLLALADCYDALTSSRAYRQALSTEEALEILRAGAGSQFDPDLVPRFIGLIRS